MSYVLVNTESGLDEMILDTDNPFDAAYQALELLGYNVVERESDQGMVLDLFSDNFD